MRMAWSVNKELDCPVQINQQKFALVSIPNISSELILGSAESGILDTLDTTVFI